MDGTDIPIEEPCHPINPKWYVHKLNRAAVRYKLAIGIHTGWIVWINGLFPAGQYSDVTIVRQSLIHFLNKNKKYIADGAYRDGDQWSLTPIGTHTYRDRQMTLIWSRHKTINARLKEWYILLDRFWHPLSKHSLVFWLVANIVQLGLETDRPAFQIHYDKIEFRSIKNLKGDVIFHYLWMNNWVVAGHHFLV